MNNILNGLDEMIPNPVCSLNYNKDYELLIAIMLSAMCTDARVNIVTKELFNKYDIYSLANASIKDIIKIIKPVGSFNKKSYYIKEIATRLVKDYNGVVPNNRAYLESLPGIGRKTCNVFLSTIYKEDCIAVDTHVNRVSKRLGLALENDDVLEVENKLMQYFPKDKWSRLHNQLVLFGRNYCKAINPKCSECKLVSYCKKNYRS